MCYLVTIGTRESAASVNALLGDESPLTVYPATNPSLKSVFPAGDRLFHVISGQCSCDLILSEEKGGPQDAFCSWLRTLALAKGGLRAFVHIYSGAFDTERVKSDERIRVTADQLISPSVLSEDRLVDIVAIRDQFTLRMPGKQRRRPESA